MPEQQNNAPSSDLVKDDLLYIVGIGTSAGGLEALQNLFDSYLPQPNMAFVIVQHLSPDYKSLMVELLSKHTEMKVYQVQDGMKIKGNSVYVMPARKDITIRNGILYLKEKDPLLSINFPIDIFLHSLGHDQKEKAVGIILSGTGTDGSRGIKTIKENGGIVIVQEPSSAKFNGMPVSAISTKLLDYVLTPHEITVELKNIANMTSEPVPKGLNHSATSSETLGRILEMVHKSTGIDFSLYKRNTIYRRIERRMKLNKLNTMQEYLDFLGEVSNEIIILQKDLLIGVTQFFRDQEAFKYLESQIIPKIFEQKDPTESIRVWTPGCSTGEEAYSILMLFEEYKAKHNCKNLIKIFATDIDTSAIEIAGNGNYPVNIAVDVNKERLGRFFLQKEQSYAVNQDLRNQIVFARHNIFSDPPFNRVDMIVCRNLLIYLGNTLQKKVLSIFQFALNREGYLFLGPSESVGDLGKLLVPINKRWKFYQNKAEPRTLMADILMNATPNMSLGNYVHQPPSIPRKGLPMQIPDKFKEALIERFSPMCAFVNLNMDALYLSGGINRYIRLPEKQLTLNIMKMIPDELVIPLSTAVRKVMKSKEPVRYNNIQTQIDGEDQVSFDLQVERINQTEGLEPFLLISLFKQDRKAEIEGEVALPVSEMAAERINFLEQQLKDTRENLQSTIEELETSNEELQASNEELMAANEELQSTNEELQSVNEELHTVNSEFQEKILELTELSNDMDNLMKSTEIGTIFLDKEMRIRKFTPTISDYFKLIDQDIGRPISHFNTDLGEENIVALSQDVLDNHLRIEKEINRPDGSAFLMRLLPYKTEDNRSNGVVITFIDISDFKAAIVKNGEP